MGELLAPAIRGCGPRHETGKMGRVITNVESIALRPDSFARELRVGLPEGTVLNNPGRGTTTVVWCDEERLCYQRGQSRFYVRLSDLHNAYSRHIGKNMTTVDLKAFAPHVFDSSAKGHNCNATVLMLALREMGLASQIFGRGQRGSPFGVTVKGPRSAVE
jgi:hypothetical protein